MKQNDKDSLGTRAKKYEECFRTFLPKRVPLIIRLDGKGFHTYTAKCKKPYDENLIEVMNLTAIELCEQISGAQMAYVQSDEISILVHGYKTIHTQPWFDNNLNKILSISSAIASTTFTINSNKIWGTGINKIALFDSRAFIVPENDVCNVLLWRQQDCTRNSIQMFARSLFSHKECNNKNTSELKEMCLHNGHDYEDLPIFFKRGRCIINETYQVNETTRNRWTIENNIPIFSQNRDYINKFLETED